ncbi:MAG: FHA domain-containing protein [Akkermansiaceae bacterium]
MRLTVHFPEDSPTTHEAVGDKLTIGRLVGNDVALDEASVSSRHAEIVLQDGVVILRDLDSTNGTFLNGEQMTGEHPLNQGDEIYFGGVRSVFMEPAGVMVESAPLPAAEPSMMIDAAGGGRPENFRRLSPFPPAVEPRDRLALAAWVLLGVGVAAALYGLVVIIAA